MVEVAGCGGGEISGRTAGDFEPTMIGCGGAELFAGDAYCGVRFCSALCGTVLGGDTIGTADFDPPMKCDGGSIVNVCVAGEIAVSTSIPLFELENIAGPFGDVAMGTSDREASSVIQFSAPALYAT